MVKRIPPHVKPHLICSNLKARLDQEHVVVDSIGCPSTMTTAFITRTPLVSEAVSALY